ncbi:hypothetical protein TRICI_002493 [Trichomonascus ciferrii]|uniref:Mmc1 C-terminal domain-containing protein n=1 Tax=Trichomonascus ciferrii TaxID=44093 RepID=A0A642V5R3_9ASCO|nr:hypothetical protein TRICI_002493 [Trichomonascus ciferrii]
MKRALSRVTASRIGARFYSGQQVPNGTASSSSSKLYNALQAIKKHYPDRYRLHARIDNYIDLTQSGKVRVGVIPFKCHRMEVNGVLEAVLADPLASDQSWYEAFKNRLLAKDVLVTFSPTFENQILAHNSLIEFPVPFREVPNARTTEIMEVNSIEDSKEHLDTCHYHVFLSSNMQEALTTPIESHFPHVLAIDVPASNELLAQEGKKIDSKVVLISSEAANRGIELLAQSPANVSQYTKLLRQSKIGELEDCIFTTPHEAEKKVLDCITYSCEMIVAPSTGDELAKTVERESDAMRRLRTKWSREAHEELQLKLTKGLQDWSKKTMAWYKLYFRVDDIYDSLSDVLQRDYLVDSNAKLEYLLGRIDSFAARHNFPEAVQLISGQEDATLVLHESIPISRQKILDDKAVKVHNEGLKAVATVIFGMQLPTILVSSLGMYFYDYTFYSMGSVMALGLVLGFRSLQKIWQRTTDQFKNDVVEEARRAIGECEFSIWKRWESKVLDGQESISKQIDVLEDLKTEIHNEYND